MSNIRRISKFIAYCLGCVCVLALLASMVIHNFLTICVRSPESRTRAEIRTLATALESYYIDNNSYPPWSTGEKGQNGSLKPSHESYHMPTFRTYDGENNKYASLSTPIAYITNFPRDPFTPGDKSSASFVYYTGVPPYTTATAWILISAGPDRHYDINPFEDFFPDTLPTSPSLVLKTYDPTNGVKSPGDIWRTSRSGAL